jgi:hypothetical protein
MFNECKAVEVTPTSKASGCHLAQGHSKSKRIGFVFRASEYTEGFEVLESSYHE